MTDINEIKRELEALTAKVAAYESEKATKRNWPERIEAGMCFSDDEERYIFTMDRQLINLSTGNTYANTDAFGGDEKDFDYLGHARDILTIRTDAHEPTGAELVGRVCEFTNASGDLIGLRMVCAEYDPSGHGPYKYRAEDGRCFCGARLTK